jgi:EF-hand domain pair
VQDKDRNGSISNSELETSMKELPHFKELSSADIRVLMTALDADGSGQISLDEFKGFVHGRKEFKGPVSTGVKSTRKPDPPSPKDVSGGMPLEKRAIFLRELTRIAKADGK